MQRSQCADKGEQRCFSRPRRPGKNNNLAFGQIQRNIVENLFFKLAFAEVEVEVFNLNEEISLLVFVKGSPSEADARADVFLSFDGVDPVVL